MRSDVKGLIVFNAVLLTALAAVTFVPSAGAEQPQPSGAAPTGAAGPRQRGSYTLLSSRVLGGQESALFILDAANREAAVMQWDQSRREMVIIGRRDLSADAAAAQTGVRPR